MKKLPVRFFLLLSVLLSGAAAPALALEPIVLNKPDLTRGKAIMEALAERHSTRTFDARDLSLQDLSDLCWAATGVNRPDGRRTNPTAMNKQEIDLYVCFKTGSYLYDVKAHKLVPVGEGDARPLPKAPVNLVIVGPSDFRLAEVDAGIVSQNISLFCAGIGLATVPRATMDAGALKKALALTGTQKPILNHPVGYFEK